MIRTLEAVGLLVGIASLAAVACDGEDEAAAPPPAAAAAAAEPTAEPAEPTGTVTQSFKGGPVPESALAPVDLSNEGDVVDLTVMLHDGTTYIYGTPPFRYEPMDLTFRLGQTVNITLEFANPDSRLKHTFTNNRLGLSGKAAFGKSTTFTFTFDEVGSFHVFCTVYNPMTGTITVVE